jgi:hypothetical protein
MVAILARHLPSAGMETATGTRLRTGTGTDDDGRPQSISFGLGSDTGDTIDGAPVEVACQLARCAGFHRAEAMCHLIRGNHLATLHALAADTERPLGALRYADTLLGTNFCERFGGTSAAASAAAAHTDVATHARTLPPDVADSFRTSLLAALPLLAAAAPEPAMHLATTVFGASQGAVLATFSSEPALQFRYLRSILGGGTHDAPRADAMILGISDLIARSGCAVTDVMAERYVQLLCRFEPGGVTRFLRDSPCGYHLRRCLAHCRRHGVSDAEAYLLERMGSADEALALPMRAYAACLRDTATHLRGAGGASWSYGRGSTTQEASTAAQRVTPIPYTFHPKSLNPSPPTLNFKHLI